MQANPPSPAPGEPAGWRIEPAGESDIDEIAELAASEIPQAWSRRGFADQLTGDAGWSWCAHPTFTGSRSPLLAYCVSRKILNELEILSLAVAAGARRRGIARSLVDRVLSEASTSGVDVVHLEVRASNHAAQALYRDRSFEVVGVRPRYYSNGEDALLMRCGIADS